MNWFFMGLAVLGAGALALRRYKPWLEQVFRPLTESGAGELVRRQATPLDRLIDALRHEKDPLTRQRLLGEIVEESWRQRAAPAMNKLFRRFAAKQVQELSETAAVLKAANGGRMPAVKAFAYLAAALEEEGRLTEALSISTQALALGLKDGGKTGFSGRIKRLRKKIKDDRPAPRPASGRRRGPPASRT
jgi:hypothetical protein